MAAVLRMMKYMTTFEASIPTMTSVRARRSSPSVAPFRGARLRPTEPGCLVSAGAAEDQRRKEVSDHMVESPQVSSQNR